MDRREFIRRFGVGSASLLISGGYAPRAFGNSARVPLPGSALPRFVDLLPTLSVAGGTVQTVVAGAAEIELHMREFLARVLPSTFVPATGTYQGTWVWGFIAGSDGPSAALDTFIGPVFVATRGQPTQVKYVNDLGNTSSSRVRAWVEATDQTLHWADPLNGAMNMCAHGIVPGQPPTGSCAEHYAGAIPAVTHLHGGEVPAAIDGGPDAWFTSDGSYHGPAYYSSFLSGGNFSVYRYPNSQEAAPLWFHDHVLGVTRLNVYAGLAGAYLLVDPANPPPANLPGPAEIVPLVLQDRMFDTDGQLFFPNEGVNPEHPFWIPEFVGDVIVVNGKAWPYLEVEPRRYRFLFLNGSNARAYELFLANSGKPGKAPALWQIGTDGGYLDFPVKIDPDALDASLQKLLLLPGERASVIIDFAGLEGETLILRNTGRTPYPKGEPPNGATLGQVIQFRVQPGAVADTSYDPADGGALRSPMVRLVNPDAGTLAAGVTAQETRQLTLNEVLSGDDEPLEVLVNNTEWDGKREDGSIRPDYTPVTINGITEYLSELPQEGDTEVWEIVNLTADAHPIHTHLTQFQLMNRQRFNRNRYEEHYEAAFPGGEYIPTHGPPLDYNTGNPRALGGNPDITPYLQGPVMPPAANEAGWKDTIVALPGQVTRIAIRYAPTSKPIDAPDLYYPFEPNDDGRGYVWHCHILDHEDNEMMRPYQVGLKGGAMRAFVKGADY